MAILYIAPPFLRVLPRCNPIGMITRTKKISLLLEPMKVIPPENLRFEQAAFFHRVIVRMSCEGTQEVASVLVSIR